MKINCITIDKNRKSLLEENKFKVFTGYTPKTLPRFHVPQKKGASIGTDKEHACLLSHLKCIEQNQSDNYIFICEDDIIFKWLSAQDILDHIDKTAPDDWECLQLYTNNYKAIYELGYKYSEKNEYWCLWNRNFWSTMLYVIKRESASKLLNWFKSNDGTWDFSNVQQGKLVADDVLYRYLNTYTSTLPLVDADNKKSNIHPNHMQLHKTASKTAEMIRFYLPKI